MNNGGGLWAYDKERDTWHLVTRRWEGFEGDGEILTTWCARDFIEADTDSKSGDRLTGMADTVHDSCWRKAEELYG